MKYYNKLLLFSFFLLTLSGCKKVINIPEADLIEGDKALTTVGFNEQAILGAYAATGIEMAILLNATFADEVKVAEFYNAGTTHEWQYASTDVGLRDNYTATTPNYRVIDRVNRVLEALPGADSTKAGDNALRLRLRGEALFLRALCHFELFRFYCANYDPAGLAMYYMEKAQKSEPWTPQARINMDPYFVKMSADVAEAKTLLPNNLTDVNRATRLAATALQARIALYKRDWSAAETFASEFITGLPLASMANFPGIWTDANTSEVAFRLVRTSSFGGRMGSLWRGISASASNIGTVTWRPSDKIWGAYDQVNDVRFASYFKDEPLLAARGSRLIYKYAGTTYATPNENVANAKVYRTGEMYLIRAEARAEQNKITGANSAESDINALRTARITGYVNVVFATKTEAIDAIMLERFKELAYEGHRFWDLKRRGLPVQRLASDAPTANAAVLPAGNFRFLLPIPDPEMKANTLMVQNPGYN